MKTIYYFLIIALSATLFSCRSVEKLVDKGRYNEAIDLAVRKLHNRKNIKTKHIRALEEGFGRISNRDLKRLGYMREQDAGNKWDRIYSLILRIEERQERIDLLLPIKSEEGYTATFEFIETSGLKEEARENAADFHFSQALSHLSLFDSTGNKSLARTAFREAELTENYVIGYQSIDEVKEKAYRHGLVRILIRESHTNVGWESSGLRYATADVLSQIDNQFWIKFYDSFAEGIEFDATVQFTVDYISMSPEREDVFQKEEIRYFDRPIVSGARMDSTQIDNDESDQLEATISITEIRRSKELKLTGYLDYIDFRTGQLLNREEVNIIENFSCRTHEEFFLRGDESPIILDRFPVRRGNLVPFPSDVSMMYEISRKVDRKLKSFANRIQVS